jgi:uncharacterized membrane protein
LKIFGLICCIKLSDLFQLSFHGVPWLAGCMAMLYFGFSQYLWINMLLLLVVDIVFVSIIKAFTRRRRPLVNKVLN